MAPPQEWQFVLSVYRLSVLHATLTPEGKEHRKHKKRHFSTARMAKMSQKESAKRHQENMTAVERESQDAEDSALKELSTQRDRKVSGDIA